MNLKCFPKTLVFNAWLPAGGGFLRKWDVAGRNRVTEGGRESRKGKEGVSSRV